MFGNSALISLISSFEQFSRSTMMLRAVETRISSFNFICIVCRIAALNQE